jgi:hypothetical protein
MSGHPNFIQNKYHKWYFSIIDNAKNKNIEKGEKHHIIPKSLGGDNNKSNIVKLSYKEHFIAHLLLIKFTMGPEKRKMLYALYLMLYRHPHDKQINLTSRLYEKIKMDYFSCFESPFSIPKIHKKTIENRTKNGTNIFSTNNPMHNIDSIKKKISKCSGKNHYLVKKYSWYFKYEWDIEWKEIPIKTSLEQYCLDIGLSSALVYKLIKTKKSSIKGKFKGIMFMREINEN